MERRIEIPWPTEGRYPPYYENYYRHVSRDRHILDALTAQKDEVLQLLSGLTPEQQDYSYAPGKWTVKEVIGHCVDTERIFSYRALCFARGEQQNLPGYDENLFTAAGRFNERSLESILSEFRSLRESNLVLFNSFSEEDMLKGGVASGYNNAVNSIIYVLAGHLQHHVSILKERYGITGA